MLPKKPEDGIGTRTGNALAIKIQQAKRSGSRIAQEALQFSLPFGTLGSKERVPLSKFFNVTLRFGVNSIVAGSAPV